MQGGVVGRIAEVTAWVAGGLVRALTEELWAGDEAGT